MNRRTYTAACLAGVVGATAGCLDDARDALAQVEETLDDDASGVVRRAQAETFEVDAQEGDEVTAEIRIEEAGSGRGEVTVRDPDGTELENDRFSFTGFDRETVRVVAPQDGTYSVHVDPGRDRDTELRVSLWVNEDG